MSAGVYIYSDTIDAFFSLSSKLSQILDKLNLEESIKF